MASWQEKDYGWVISKAKLAFLLGWVLAVLGLVLGDTILGVLALASAIVLIPAGLLGLVRTWRR